MSPERSPERRAGVIAIEPLSPERAEPGLATGMSLDGTPERLAAASPTDPVRHGRAPPDPTDSIVWFPVGDLRAVDILDAVQHPATYVSQGSLPLRLSFP